jgi:hypothetical protein
MNLYQVNIKHLASKDSANGIYCYLFAESNEDVYEWIKKETYSEDEIDTLFVSWEDYEEDYENFKEDVVEACDIEDTDYASYDDLYYGKTFVSWKLCKSNTNDSSYVVLSELGIRVFNSK